MAMIKNTLKVLTRLPLRAAGAAKTTSHPTPYATGAAPEATSAAAPAAGGGRDTYIHYTKLAHFLSLQSYDGFNLAIDSVEHDAHHRGLELVAPTRDAFAAAREQKGSFEDYKKMRHDAIATFEALAAQTGLRYQDIFPTDEFRRR